MLLSRVLAVSLMIFSPLVLADALDINLNNNAAQFKFSSSAGIFIQGNSKFHVGALYNDVNNTLGEAGLIVRGSEANVPGLSVGVGARAVLGTIKNYITPTINAQAIAIGGEVGYTLPTAKKVAIVGDYFAGPKITTFGDAERFNQFSVRAQYEIIPQTRAYLEYREINFGIKDIAGFKAASSAMLDSGWHVGVKIAF